MGFGLDMQLRWTTHQHAADPDRLILESESSMLYAMARAFAAAAETELRAGEAYLRGFYEGLEQLKIANDLGRTIPHLRKFADLFEPA